MSSPAVIVEGLGKRYLIGAKQQANQTAGEILADAFGAPVRRLKRVMQGQAHSAADLEHELWALRDISFEVRPGEVLGIIGSNGAGKSTLLKLLSRITEPTEGRIRLRGRVGSLLEVGTGFHPELTGRENTLLNGTILGMSRGEIVSQFDQIVEFAGVEEHIDTPVKHYSSGMYVRLAFAVAAHLNPEILVVDEVLAVGDAEFRQKCLGKMNDIANQGRTVLFVSHNLSALAALCGRSILLRRGRLVAEGPPQEVISEYVKPLSKAVSPELEERSDRDGVGPVRFTSIEFLNDHGEPVPVGCSGKPLTIRVGYLTSGSPKARGVDMDIAFYGPMGQLMFVCKATLGNGGFPSLPEGRNHILCNVPKLPLSPSQYRVKLWASCERVMSDRIENATTLTVEPGDFYGSGVLPKRSHEGVVMVDHNWRVVENGSLPGGDVVVSSASSLPQKEQVESPR